MFALGFAYYLDYRSGLNQSPHNRIPVESPNNKKLRFIGADFEMPKIPYWI